MPFWKKQPKLTPQMERIIGMLKTHQKSLIQRGKADGHLHLPEYQESIAVNKGLMKPEVLVTLSQEELDQIEELCRVMLREDAEFERDDREEAAARLR